MTTPPWNMGGAACTNQAMINIRCSTVAYFYHTSTNSDRARDVFQDGKGEGSYFLSMESQAVAV